MYEDGEWDADDTVHDDFGFQDAAFHIVVCPHCGSDASRIVSTVFGADGEAWSMNCLDCGKRFEMLKKFGGTTSDAPPPSLL